MMHAANSESFSHLNLPVLKDKARSWVDGFSDEPIKRIILYQYSRPPKERSKPLWDFKAVYAIVFEVDADDHRVNMNSEEGARFLEEKLKDKRALFPGERLLDATGQYQTVGDENQRAYFLTADFECVYKTPPSSDFLEKWVFRVKFNNKPLDPNIRDEGPNVILYHATEEKESSLPSNNKDEHFGPGIPQISYQGRHRSPYMTAFKENNPKNFPDLRLEHLQRYAKRWVEKFSQVQVEKILLYYASNDYFRDASVKYTIVFEFNEEPRSEMNRINQDFTNLIWPLMSKRYKLKTAVSSRHEGLPRGWGCYRFQYNSIMASIKTKELHLFFWNRNRTGKFDPTEHVKRIQKPRIVGPLKLSELKLTPLVFFQGRRTPFDDFLTAVNHEKKIFIDAGFDVVYNSKPGTWEDCLSEWAFKIKTPETGIGKSIKTDEPSWMLYPAEQDSNSTYKENYVEQPKKSPPITGAIKRNENYFIREGDIWKVGFAGETTTLKDSKGLRTVVALLKNPNYKFYPSKLAALSEGGHENLSDDELKNSDLILKMSKTVNKEDDDDERSLLEREESLSMNDLPLENLDSHDIKKFEKIIFNLWNEHNQKSDDWKKRWDEMKSYMRSEHGVIIKSTPKGPKFKFQHRLKKDEEKARQGISKNINRFKDRIKNEMPKLHKHLDHHITPGAIKPSYTVDSENLISWEIKD